MQLSLPFPSPREERAGAPPAASRVFTIPPSAPFLSTLIRALRDGRLVDGFTPGPPDFADVTIFLPTRRACRLTRDTFLQVLGVDAAVLPRLVPIGDIDEDELVFAEMATGDIAAYALALPPALGGLERRFLLARLVLKWAEQIAPLAGETPLVMRHPAAALALADDLARLMDDMTTREVPWQRLDGLVPTRGVARHSRRTRRHRAGDAAGSLDRRRGRAPRRTPRSTSHRGGFDRLHAGNGQAPRHHRGPAPWRRGAPRPRHRA